jgi:hypothetical protein
MAKDESRVRILDIPDFEHVEFLVGTTRVFFAGEFTLMRLGGKGSDNVTMCSWLIDKRIARPLTEHE